MARSARQMKILEIIQEKDIDTQDELAAQLQSAGFEVTQATISRDIKELGIVKVAIGSSKQKYTRDYGDFNSISAKISNLFKHSVLSIECANNLIVIKTLTGSANMAGMMVDGLNNSSVLGCVAGDDTVFIAVKTNKDAENLTDILRQLIAQ